MPAAYSGRPVRLPFGALLGFALALSAGAAMAQGPKRPGPRGVAPHPADAAPRPLAGETASSGGPADFESTHFLLHTDMPAKDAHDLLAKLETMVSLISKYWGRAPNGVIELNVVRDLGRWPAGSLDPAGVAKIAEEAGITLTQTLTRGSEKVAAKAVVYAIAKPGVAQHEAVHAYCGQTFGTCGPLWYAEGMAEMGQYWRPGESSVKIHDIVMDYLQHTSPQSLNEIVNTNSMRTMRGDSWQNYAWRWALCHLLANNPNYSKRFQPLGLGYLTEQNVSFEETYGPMSKEISFEYLFFVGHIEQGFRVDLCSWDWKKKSKALVDTAPVSIRVGAGRGWQSSGVTVRAGKTYEYSAVGSWQVGGEKTAVTADGDAAGSGRLVGVLFNNFELTAPFGLGAYGKFKAPQDGQLFLRCQSHWGEIPDNKGNITLKLRLAGSGDPLPVPPGAKKPASDSEAEESQRNVWPEAPQLLDGTRPPQPEGFRPMPEGARPVQKPAPADAAR